KWRTVSWRSGTKGRLKARFAALRVRIADGPPQRIWDKGQQHLPGDEAWLIGEHRASGEKKYYLANLPAGMDLRALAATIKARWVCEQAHQQLKEELGLDHFDGAGGPGPRPFGGALWRRPPRASAHENARHPLPPAPPPRQRAAEKKESTAHRLNQACRPCATPSSRSSSDRRRGDAPIAEH